jgi:hypothetical protein
MKLHYTKEEITLAAQTETGLRILRVRYLAEDMTEQQAELERLTRQLAALKLQYDREAAASDRRCDHIVAMQTAAAAVLDWWEEEEFEPNEAIGLAMNNLRIAAKFQAEPTDDPDGEADRAHATKGDR